MLQLKVGGKQLKAKCLSMPSLVDNFEIIIGMDIILRIVEWR